MVSIFYLLSSLSEQLYQYVTTMVCVAVQGKPVIGVVHQPFEKTPTTSWAWVERGESSDLVVQKINVSWNYLLLGFW